jgi:hypothetical protein
MTQCVHAIDRSGGERSIAGEAMYRVSDAVRATHGRDGGILLDVERGRMFDLNLVGSRILELLNKGSSESEIVDCVSSEFNARQDLVESDVREFMQALRDHRLIEEQNSNKRS